MRMIRFWVAGTILLAQLPFLAQASDPQLAEVERLASGGHFSAPLVAAFYRYAELRVKNMPEVSDDVWAWLSKQHDLRHNLLVGLHPNYNPRVVRRLAEMHYTFGDELDRHYHLGLAFAFAYGATSAGNIRAPWMNWVAAGREVPSCTDSFAYYLKNRERMLLSFDRLPWPLLLFIADNDVPLAEREWVLSHYRGRALGDLHGQPKHVKGASAVKEARNGASMALNSILAEGGVCSQQAYYASSVLKCFGVPSVRLTQNHHAYEAWMLLNPRYEFRVAADAGRKDGCFWCPLTRSRKRQYEFKLTVLAMNLSYTNYIKSLMAAQIFASLPPGSQEQATGLLLEALAGNQYCPEVWATAAAACHSGSLPTQTGWNLVEKAMTILSGTPEVASLLAEGILAAESRRNGNAWDLEHSPSKERIDSMCKWLEDQQRPDLKLRLINHGRPLGEEPGDP
jgi:hypothetical protein